MAGAGDCTAGDCGAVSCAVWIGDDGHGYGYANEYGNGHAYVYVDGHARVYVDEHACVYVDEHTHVDVNEHVAYVDEHACFYVYADAGCEQCVCEYGWNYTGLLGRDCRWEYHLTHQQRELPQQSDEP